MKGLNNQNRQNVQNSNSMQNSQCGNAVVGLDIGTTKICAIAGKEVSGRLEFIAVESSPSYGLRKGVVVDVDLTVNSIKETLRKTEEKTGFSIRSAYIGIAGGNIKGFNAYGAIGIKNGEIKKDDVARLMDSAGAVYVPVDREILHIIPAGFRLDGRNGIMNPVGMQGKRLEVNAHIVTGSLASVQSLIRCCEAAGVEVADIIFESLASAEAVLSKGEKEAGVILIDIGGGTTDISVYKNGVLRHTAVLSLGGNHLTNDIAMGLALPHEEAERIKKTYGCAWMDLEAAHDNSSIADKETRFGEAQMRYLTEIIHARTEELINLVKKETASAPNCSSVLSVVLTGGTSLLAGLKELTEDVFKLPVRIGFPEDIADSGMVNSPVYATGVGLVRYGLNHYIRTDMLSAGLLASMKNWVSGFFNK